MSQEILNYISKFVTLTEEETKALMEDIPVRTFPKGTLLIREGDLLVESYFVLKGCLRQYYLTDGEEKTTFFYEEEQAVPSFNPTQQVYSTSYLSCVEDSTLVICYPDRAEAMFKRFPKFESLCRILTEEDLGKTQEAFATFITSSPEERYLNLLKNRPGLINRVPQYQLASYLGIKPESLSRIRKRITVNV